jgi:outer membrane protein assembly factor BamB
MVLYRNLVIVPAFAESKALVAIEKETGRQVWKSPADGFDGSWSSPILVDLPDGKQELVVSVPFEIWGYDPANGDFLWFAEGIKEGVICPTLTSKDGVVYAIGGQRGGAVAIRAGGRDDVTKTHTVWRKNLGSYVTSPVLFDDYLYWVTDKAIACCVKIENGEQVYRERLADARQLYSSVVIANGSLFAVSRDDGTYVFPAKPQFGSVTRNVVDDDAGTCNATPAFSNGRMYLRTNRYLYCIAKK